MRLRGIRARLTTVNAAAKRLRTVFVVVPCIFMIAILVLPALNGLVLSFEHHGPSLANYRILFDDSMFWRGMDALNAPENLEWLDWNRTPSTGRRLDWSSKPTRIAPQPMRPNIRWW